MVIVEPDRGDYIDGRWIGNYYYDNTTDPLRSPNCPPELRLPDMPPITDGEDT